MKHLQISSRQKTRKINLPRLRRIALHLLGPLLSQDQFNLAVHLVDQTEMTGINERFLQHSGSTDVITFDYGNGGPHKALEGEIFISIDDAILHATRFRTQWHEETVRYLVHGVLHLLKFDDQTPALRRVMKGRETRLLRALARSFPLVQIEKSLNP